MRCLLSEWILWIESHPLPWMQKMAQRHLHSCPKCQKKQVAQSACTMALKQRASDESKEVSDFLHHSIMERVKREEEKKRLAKGSEPWPLFRYAAAGLCMAIAGIIGLVFIIKEPIEENSLDLAFNETISHFTDTVGKLPEVIQQSEELSLNEIEYIKEDLSLVISPLGVSTHYFLSDEGVIQQDSID